MDGTDVLKRTKSSWQRSECLTLGFMSIVLSIEHMTKDKNKKISLLK